MKKIAIIVPAYNEDENISKLVKKILSFRKDVNIFIVDDSHKKTSETYILKNKKVFYFHRKKKLGRGSAVLYGLKSLNTISTVFLSKWTQIFLMIPKN